MDSVETQLRRYGDAVQSTFGPDGGEPAVRPLDSPTTSDDSPRPWSNRRLALSAAAAVLAIAAGSVMFTETGRFDLPAAVDAGRLGSTSVQQPESGPDVSPGPDDPGHDMPARLIAPPPWTPVRAWDTTRWSQQEREQHMTLLELETRSPGAAVIETLWLQLFRTSPDERDGEILLVIRRGGTHHGVAFDDSGEPLTIGPFSGYLSPHSTTEGAGPGAIVGATSDTAGIELASADLAPDELRDFAATLTVTDPSGLTGFTSSSPDYSSIYNGPPPGPAIGRLYWAEWSDGTRMARVQIEESPPVADELSAAVSRLEGPVPGAAYAVGDFVVEEWEWGTSIGRYRNDLGVSVVVSGDLPTETLLDLARSLESVSEEDWVARIEPVNVKPRSAEAE